MITIIIIITTITSGIQSNEYYLMIGVGAQQVVSIESLGWLDRLYDGAHKYAGIVINQYSVSLSLHLLSSRSFNSLIGFGNFH